MPEPRFGVCLRFWLVVTAAALLLAACSPEVNEQPTDPRTVESAGQAFVEASPERTRLFKPTKDASPPGFHLEVFVDQSASMRGYVDSARSPTAAPVTNKGQPKPLANPAPPANGFVTLLRELANEGELLSFYGFGTDAALGSTTTLTPCGHTAPIDGRAYQRANNDYADLLQLLAKRPVAADGLPIERIIISDGVQSAQDSGTGSALNGTVQALRSWIQDGGIVEIRLFNAPFTGTYYSEELRARRIPGAFPAQTTTRPFLAISLLRSKADLPMWESFWARSAFAGVSSLATQRFPAPAVAQTSVTLEPEARIPKEVPTTVLFRNVWDLARVQTLDDFQDIWRARVARIRTTTEADPTTYPACFLLKGLSHKTESEAATELRAMKPMLTVWQQPKLPPSKGNPPPTPVNAWQPIQNVDLRDFTNGKVRVDWTGPSEAAFRFTAALPVPSHHTVQAVMITTTPRSPEVSVPDFRAFSTLDDSSAAHIGQIYNLQPFVEQLDAGTRAEPSPLGLLVLTYR